MHDRHVLSCGAVSISPDTLEEMRKAAVKASRHAYAPYSKFKVGAAVLADDGSIYAGANVENASFGLTVCAERNALFQAVSKGAKGVLAVLIYAPVNKPTPPCGACRQVINEFGPHADIISIGEGGASTHHTMSQLLPEAFGPGSF